MMKFKFHRIEQNYAVELPQRATRSSAGVDLRAHMAEPLVIPPGERRMIGTGLWLELNDGFAMVCSRSGLAAKYGVFVLNAPGIIDEDYQPKGWWDASEDELRQFEVKVILMNAGPNPFTVQDGDRIAQVIPMPYVLTEEGYHAVDLGGYTAERRTGGFGSTGV